MGPRDRKRRGGWRNGKCGRKGEAREPGSLARTALGGQRGVRPGTQPEGLRARPRARPALQASPRPGGPVCLPPRNLPCGCACGSGAPGGAAARSRRRRRLQLSRPTRTRASARPSSAGAPKSSAGSGSAASASAAVPGPADSCGCSAVPGARLLAPAAGGGDGEGGQGAEGRDGGGGEGSEGGEAGPGRGGRAGRGGEGKGKRGSGEGHVGTAVPIQAPAYSPPTPASNRSPHPLPILGQVGAMPAAPPSGSGSGTLLLSGATPLTCGRSGWTLTRSRF